MQSAQMNSPMKYVKLASSTTKKINYFEEVIDNVFFQIALPNNKVSSKLSFLDKPKFLSSRISRPVC